MSSKLIPKAAHIINTTASEIGIAPKSIVGSSREHSTAIARHIAIGLCKQHTTYTQRQLAIIFGRPPSGIHKSLKKFKAYNKNPIYQPIINQIQAAL